jgi:pilus assembly protein CpaF
MPALHERLGEKSAVKPVENGRDPFADLKNSLHQTLIANLGPELFNGDTATVELDRRVREEVRRLLDEEPGIAQSDRRRLLGEIADDMVGHGPLEPLLADESITEIMVNGAHDVWVERAGNLSPTDVRFIDDSHVRRIVNKIVAQVGRRIDESSPMVDARLRDGSRVNVVIPPLSLSGTIVTIRKFSQDKMGLSDLIKLGAISKEAADFLERCVRAELNILISGGTGTGKTTLLNAISSAIPDDDRIITIEDAAELQLNQRHVLRLEARPKNIEGEGEIPIRELVRNALRMRPDRIIIGECRGMEALDMLQAMNTGHDGSLSTVHANTPRDALARLETMVLMAGFELPVRAIRQQVCSALELIVQLERMEDGTRKIASIAEVQRMESDVITMEDLFRFETQEVRSDGAVVGHLRPTGIHPSFVEKFRKHGVELPASLFADRPRMAVAR